MGPLADPPQPPGLLLLCNLPRRPLPPHVNHQVAKLVCSLGAPARADDEALVLAHVPVVPPSRYAGAVEATRLGHLGVPLLGVHRQHVRGLHQPRVCEGGGVVRNAREICGAVLVLQQ